MAVEAVADLMVAAVGINPDQSSYFSCRYVESEMGRRNMQRMKWNNGGFHWGHISKFAAGAVLLVGFAPHSLSRSRQARRHLRRQRKPAKLWLRRHRITMRRRCWRSSGRKGKRLFRRVTSAEDTHSRSKFAEKYGEMHRLVKEPDGMTTLYIGAENWPTPIPLVHKGKVWYFDTAAGKKEILFRRVGLNEMSAIRICEELVAAQKEYYSSQHNEYAQKIFSDPDQHDGLYWKAAANEPQSPIGPRVAEAVSEGYVKGEGAPTTPYRGYFFHVLPRQGKNASGGAKNYVVGGKMTGGFAFVAYPAEYRASGVMTFIVAEDGVVYQKDLGPKTEIVGKALKEYDPGVGWSKTGEMPEQTAAESTK